MAERATPRSAQLGGAADTGRERDSEILRAGAPSRNPLAEILRQHGAVMLALADRLEVPQSTTTAEPWPYVTRKQAIALGVEARVFDACARERGCSRPGRETMLRRTELFDFIEAHRIEPRSVTQPANDAVEEPGRDSFAAFRRNLLRRQGAR